MVQISRYGKSERRYVPGLVQSAAVHLEIDGGYVLGRMDADPCWPVVHLVSVDELPQHFASLHVNFPDEALSRPRREYPVPHPADVDVTGGLGSESPLRQRVARSRKYGFCFRSPHIDGHDATRASTLEPAQIVDVDNHVVPDEAGTVLLMCRSLVVPLEQTCPGVDDADRV